MIAHTRPGLLRSSSVSKCCFLNWDQGSSNKSTPAAVARPPPSIPPASSSPQPQPSQVAVRAAAEQDVVVVAQPAVPAAPAGKLPPPSRSFWDAMKFSGPAPELINGRLAMIGILAAAKHEAETGATVLQQALQASPWLYAVLGLWVYASMVPIFKGVRHEAFGFFTPRAEITNGRAAMLGFAVLVALEYKAGVPFF